MEADRATQTHADAVAAKRPGMAARKLRYIASMADLYGQDAVCVSLDHDQMQGHALCSLLRACGLEVRLGPEGLTGRDRADDTGDICDLMLVAAAENFGHPDIKARLGMWRADLPHARLLLVEMRGAGPTSTAPIKAVPVAQVPADRIAVFPVDLPVHSRAQAGLRGECENAGESIVCACPASRETSIVEAILTETGFAFWAVQACVPAPRRIGLEEIGEGAC